MRLLSTALACLVALAPTAVTAKPPYQWVLSGGAAGGVWSLIGTGVNNAVAAQFPGSTVTYQTSAGGGLANIPQVSEKRAKFALAEDAGLRLALAGQPPFRKKYSDLRGIAFIAGWLPMHMIVEKGFAEKYKLRNFSDIAKVKPPLRVTINRRSNIAAHVSLKMFEAIGVTPKDIESWGGQLIYQPSPEQLNLMLDRRVDMVSNQVPIKHRMVRQMEQSVKLVLLDIDPGLANRVAKDVGQQVYTIPKDTYPWQDSEVVAPSLGTTLITNTALDEQSAYDLTKALVEQIDKIRAAHPFLKQLTKEYLASLKVVPYHPGAVRYYKEAGLM